MDIVMQSFSLLNAHKFSSLFIKLLGYSLIFLGFCLPIGVAPQSLGMILVILFAILAGNWRANFNYLSQNKIMLWVLFLFLIFFVGTCYSSATPDWRIHMFKRAAEFLLTFGVAVALLNTKNKNLFNQSIVAYLLGCLFVFVVAVIGGVGLLPAWKIFSNPAPYYTFFKIYGAFFVAFGAFIALHQFLNIQSRKQKIFYIVTFILLTYNVLFMSLSRTGYIIYFVLMMSFLLKPSNKKYLFGSLLLSLFAIVLAFSFSPNLRTGLAQTYHDVVAYHEQGNNQTSGGIRIQYFKDSYHLWKKHPILGYGTGGYKDANIAIGGINASGQVSTVAHPQSIPEDSYSFILVEHGLIGFFVLLMLYGKQFFYGWQASSQSRILLLGFIVAIIIGGFANNMIAGGSTVIFYAFFTGLFFTEKRELNK